MLTFQPWHIDAVLNSEIAGDINDEPDEEKRADMVVDAFINEAPIISSYTAEQDKGEYSILVRGVPGAFSVEAQEFEDAGVFDSVEDAEKFVSMNHGEFMRD